VNSVLVGRVVDENLSPHALLATQGLELLLTLIKH